MIKLGPVEEQLRALREARWRELNEPVSKPEAVPASPVSPAVSVSLETVSVSSLTPVSPAVSPWVAAGVSRATWFRRKAALSSASSAA